MARAIFRLRLADGSIRLAGGTPDGGPTELLPAGTTVESLLAAGVAAVADAARAGSGEGVPDGSVVLAPVDAQEVWGAGVTYERSRAARMEEAVEPSIYDRVYDATRPEVFFKCVGWRVRGPEEPISVRADSGWNAPEPEFALVLTPSLEIAGYAIGNDVSSREIEGENPLYLPQAKTYDGSCAIGPAIVPVGEAHLPIGIHLRVVRAGKTIVEESTSTAKLHRTFDDLLDHLGRALSFPSGAFLLTGTGIVAGSEFSLSVGDVCRIEMDGLGVLENRVEPVGTPARPSSGRPRSA
jgi:2-dehydro-3-deoxy-D-arabinonate dehydratase